MQQYHTSLLQNHRATLAVTYIQFNTDHYISIRMFNIDNCIPNQKSGHRRRRKLRLQ